MERIACWILVGLPIGRGRQHYYEPRSRPNIGSPTTWSRKVKNRLKNCGSCVWILDGDETRRDGRGGDEAAVWSLELFGGRFEPISSAKHLDSWASRESGT